MEQKLIKPMIYEAPTKGPEEKEYIILYFIDGDSDYHQLFDKVIGRTNAYMAIASKAQMFGDTLDVGKSIVITETKQTITETQDIAYFLIHPNDALNIYDFCNHAYNFMPQEIRREFSIGDYYDDPKNTYTENDDQTTNPMMQNPNPMYRDYMNIAQEYDNSVFFQSSGDEESNV